MDAHPLVPYFRNILSLASLAYTFSGIHAIQYSMLNHDMDIDDPADLILQDNDFASHSGSTSTHNHPTVADTSQASSLEKTSRWTDHEITLLLDYVEASCTLTTARGLSLKKSEFNKARNTVKSKDSSQCHYKWGHVRVLLYIIGGLYY
jgi:hypothetical protein